METVNYRKIVIFGRLIIACGFVLTAIGLILAGLFLDASSLRKVISVVVGVVGIVFFGRLLLLMLILLMKNPHMFSYDDEKIKVSGREIEIKKIKKVELQSSVPTGILGIKTPAFVLHKNDGQTINIPTFYVLTKKDEPAIHKTLKQIISGQGKKKAK
ncbi:DUF5381 family protein [Mesobacillus maritimus]|uniref:DUF5381 family protein n=1 Tax=Mesobacillus maritimus TaxID=1643336 RepID=UPI00203B9705|nr:DUF5381 family protein [Mesobacillus maritimus]MCM3668317.1 DUF5381 family protein [Mesobacillus maritimus]